MLDQARAGDFLRDYERERYTLYDRLGYLFFRTQQTILVPEGAEEFADVSFYQAHMDWEYYRTKARAVILRIGQNTWKDTEWEWNYSECRRVGVAVGGYHFFDGRATPEAQAQMVKGALAGKRLDLELIVDWEKNYNGAYEGLPNVVKLMQLLEVEGIPCKAVGMYTGYYWFTGNSNPSTHAAQYDYLKTKPLWLAWYASASVVKVPPPWSTWTHWQWGTPVVDWGQPTAEIDQNKYNGTPSQFEARYLGTVTPPPTIPWGYAKTHWYNSDVYTVKSGYARALVTNTKGVLQTVSEAARGHGAQYALNGDGWNLTGFPKFPLSVAASAGDVYQPEQYDYRPFLDISQSNQPVIRHTNLTGLYNTVSGTRYLVREGVNQFLSSTDPEHVTERAPRSAVGYTGTDLILCVVDGRSVASQGVTVKELAEIMVEAGARYSLELDGGGSSALWVQDRIVNVPSDGAERAVVNHLLLFAGDAMANGTAKEILGNTGTVRKTPSRYGVDTGKRVSPGATIEFVKVVPVQIQGSADNPSDQWFQLPDGNYLNYILSGKAYFQILTQPTDPEPPPSGKPALMEISLVTGSVVTVKDAAGNVLWTGTA